MPHSPGSRLPVISMLFGLLLLVVLSRTAAGADLAAARQLFDQARYDEAIQLYSEIATSLGTTEVDRAEAYFRSGCCRYLLGRESAALDDFKKSIRLRPKYRPSDTELPPNLTRLYERTRSRMLCSVEVYVSSPNDLAIISRGTVNLAYREDDVIAGTILLPENPYSSVQEYALIAGQVNRFSVELQWLRDFYFFDSLYLDLKPIGTKPNPADSRSPGEMIVGGQRLTPGPNQYQSEALVMISLGDDSSFSRVYLYQPRPLWRRLLNDLDANHARKTLARRVRMLSAVGMVVSSTVAICQHVRAEDQYDDYLQAYRTEDVLSLYEEYSGKVRSRNIFTGLALAFAVSEVIALITDPKDQQELLDEYYGDGNSIGLGVDVNPSYVGLKLRVGL